MLMGDRVKVPSFALDSTTFCEECQRCACEEKGGSQEPMSTVVWGKVAGEPLRAVGEAGGDTQSAAYHDGGRPENDPEVRAKLQCFSEQGVLHVVRAAGKAYGPDIIQIAGADAYFENADYYHFGYRTRESAAAADQRMEAQRQVLRKEASRKLHRLMVGCLPMASDTRWLTLAAGTFEVERTQMHLRGGGKLQALMFGFDSESDVRAAAEQVRSRPECSSKIALLHLSRRHGGNVEVTTITPPEYAEPMEVA